jgi:Domain of unknown function (DUF4190)
MEDQNRTNLPAGENPLSTPNSEVPPVSPEPAPQIPAPPVEVPPVEVTPQVLPEPSTTYLPPPSPVTTETNYGAPPAPSRETNPWAIVSLVSSILSWIGLFGVGGIVGVIAGIVARNQIRDSAGRQEGDGLALAGIIVGAANILLVCIGLMCLMVVFGVFAYRR